VDAGDVDESSNIHEPAFSPHVSDTGLFKLEDDIEFADADEPLFINEPSFGRDGSKDLPIEIDDFEDELDDALNSTHIVPGQGSYQSVHHSSNIGINHLGTVPVTSNIGIPALSASGQSNSQSAQPGGASHGPVYPQQTQSSAVSRSSDAELAKGHADKKENKAKESAFKNQGRWWHRLSENEAAGRESPFIDRENKTDMSTVPAIQHSDIADQLRAAADSRGSYRRSCLPNGIPRPLH